jgi:prephenate dehydratase
MRVAIQGELGSFSHEAALALVPQSIVAPCATAAEVLRELDCSEVEAAVIPVENSLAGSVIDFYDLFFEHEFGIERELQMRIRHNLIVAPGTRLGTVRHVLSHPVALAQCKEFFAAHPPLKATSFYDTAGSVQHIMQEQKPELAAIASKQAAAHYGAEILEAGIEDHAESYTRFWLIRRRDCVPATDSPTKLSLVFSLENRPGALLDALGTFAARNLNLTKIESRPITGRPWEYMFYADVTLPGNEQADEVLVELRKLCPIVKELGRYSASNHASN